MSVVGILALVFAILAVVLVVVTLVLIPVRRHSARVEAELAEELGGEMRRIAAVRGLGLQSLGRAQVRGNGTLALAAGELRFRQWVPRRDVRIPVSDIVSVDTERWWLGKTVGRPLLCVRWRSGDGEDAMAWQVQDLDGWLADLRG